MSKLLLIPHEDQQITTASLEVTRYLTRVTLSDNIIEPIQQEAYVRQLGYILELLREHMICRGKCAGYCDCSKVPRWVFDLVESVGND